MNEKDKVKLPRGVRSNNPGNIDYNPNNSWKGKLLRDTSIEPRFERFDEPENGIRALGKLLITYQTKHKLNTVKQIISRWAPANENNTDAYVRAVEQCTKTKPGEPVNLKDKDVMRAMVKAIIRHENANYEYPDSVLDEGVRRALA